MADWVCVKNESIQVGTVFYGDRYPDETEWTQNFLQTIDYYGGNTETGLTCLPAEKLSNDIVKVLNTLASGLLLFAMGLSTDFDELKKMD